MLERKLVAMVVNMVEHYNWEDVRKGTAV